MKNNTESRNVEHINLKEYRNLVEKLENQNVQLEKLAEANKILKGELTVALAKEERALVTSLTYMGENVTLLERIKMLEEKGESQTLVKQVFDSEVKIDYIFIPSYNNSDTLVVSFPRYKTKKCDYLELTEGISFNQLYILDNFNARGSYCICQNGDFKVERSISSLIEKICKEHNIARKISVGIAHGGSAALYHGIKYDFDTIIAINPHYYLGTHLKENDSLHTLNFLMGSRDDEAVQNLDNLISNMMQDKRDIRSKIILCVDEHEKNYEDHILPLSVLLKEHRTPFLIQSIRECDPKNYHELLGKILFEKAPFSIVENYNIEVKDNVLSLTIQTSAHKDRLAIYLYHGDTCIERTGYETKTQFDFKVEESGIYKITIYVLNSLNHRYSVTLPDLHIEGH